MALFSYFRDFWDIYANGPEARWSRAFRSPYPWDFHKQRTLLSRDIKRKIEFAFPPPPRRAASSSCVLGTPVTWPLNPLFPPRAFHFSLLNPRITTITSERNEKPAQIASEAERNARKTKAREEANRYRSASHAGTSDEAPLFPRFPFFYLPRRLSLLFVRVRGREKTESYQ